MLRPTFEPHEVKWRLDLGLGFGTNVAFDDSFGDLDNGEMSRDRIDIDATFSLPITDAGLFLGAKVGYRGVERSAVDLHQYYFGNLRQNELGFGGLALVRACRGGRTLRPAARRSHLLAR